MGPFAAVYDLLYKRNSVNSRTGSPESGAVIHRPSHSADPPSYNQVMTGLKTPSATYNMRFTQLSANQLTEEGLPPPPPYEEIIASENQNQNPSHMRTGTPSDLRRMTSP